jgi:ribosomal protein S18 acetylase RimI-like enzyme
MRFIDAPVLRYGVRMSEPGWRIAQSADVPALHALVNSAYRGDSSRQGWTTEADLLGGQRTDAEGLREVIAAEGSVVLLLEEGGVLLACVNLRRREDSAYLGMLTVKPDLQARGTGRKMLEIAEAFVRREWKSARIEMTVIRQRDELIAWYERRGYRRTGHFEPFPYGDARFGLPKRPDLEFEVLEKRLPPHSP